MPTFNLLDKRTRNGGRHTSFEVDYPANLRQVSVTGVMDPADIQDPTLTITWKIEATFNGETWVQLLGGGWQGGLDGEGNPVGPPNQTWSTSGPLPQRVRGEIIQSKRISMGLDVDVN